MCEFFLRLTDCVFACFFLNVREAQALQNEVSSLKQKLGQALALNAGFEAERVTLLGTQVSARARQTDRQAQRKWKKG